MKRISLWVVLLIFLFTGMPATATSYSSIYLSETTLSMISYTAEKVCLKGDYYSKGKKKTATLNATWSSSNKDVATVDNGKITALNSGTATITAKYNNNKYTVNVTVTLDGKMQSWVNFVDSARVGDIVLVATVTSFDGYNYAQPYNHAAIIYSITKNNIQSEINLFQARGTDTEHEMTGVGQGKYVDRLTYRRMESKSHWAYPATSLDLYTVPSASNKTAKSAVTRAYTKYKDYSFGLAIDEIKTTYCADLVLNAYKLVGIDLSDGEKMNLPAFQPDELSYSSNVSFVASYSLAH